MQNFLVKSASTIFQNVAFWNNFGHFPSPPHPPFPPTPPPKKKKKKKKERKKRKKSEKDKTLISMGRHFMFKYMN